MKKNAFIVLAIIFFLTASAPSVFAGSKQRHQWQGAAMALGAVVLGSAILNNCQCDRPPQQRVAAVDRYRPGYHHQRPYCKPRHARGHWEYRKIWVEPTYEKVWNPGHYNACRQWVPGAYIVIERKPGYWKKERVWVSQR